MKVESIPLFLSEAHQSQNLSTTKRMKCAAEAIFEKLKTAVTFPLRYLGSKTWSVPGLIFKTPYYVFKKILNPKTDIKSELLGSGYHYKYQKKLSADEAKHFLPYTSAAVFAFSSDKKWIEPFGYKVVSPDSLDLGRAHYIRSNDSIIDLETGFKMSMLEKEDEVVIGFGGIGSLQKNLADDPEKLKKICKKQHLIAAKNILGFKESMYTSAEKLISHILSQPRWQGKKICFVGQCLGGSLAQYMALKLGHKAYCFNTFQIGAGLQELIPSKNLKNADDFVTHIACKGDFVNERPLPKWIDFFWGSLGFKTPGNFGKTFFIPTPYKTDAEIHEYAVGSLMHHIGFGKRTKPEQISDWISKTEFSPDSV